MQSCLVLFWFISQKQSVGLDIEQLLLGLRFLHFIELFFNKAENCESFFVDILSAVMIIWVFFLNNVPGKYCLQFYHWKQRLSRAPSEALGAYAKLSKHFNKYKGCHLLGTQTLCENEIPAPLSFLYYLFHHDKLSFLPRFNYCYFFFVMSRYVFASN